MPAITASRLCNIARKAGNNGYVTQCAAGACNWDWQGSVEVAEGVKGSKVRVLYRLAGSPTWWQVDASPVTYGSS